MGRLIPRYIIPALSALLVSGSVWGAKTDGSINGYLQYYDNSDAEEKNRILDIFDATVRGMEFMNSDLKSKGRPQTFCLTESAKLRFKITTEYYFSIFRKYFEKHNDLREAHHTRFNHILHSALQEAFPCPVSGPAWGETYFDLVQREGLYYKKSTEVPFSGTVTGRYQGKIKNGKRDGPWVSYHDDGTVVKFLTGTYKDGKKVK
jgi:antitoxin component YwqK of YwqJK toxin-antitoxin module